MFLKISQCSQENCIRASFNVVVLKAGTRFFNFSSKMHQKQSPRCSIKKLFLKISQNSQENTCVVVFFFRIDVLKNFSIFTRKHFVLESLFSKVADLKADTRFFNVSSKIHQQKQPPEMFYKKAVLKNFAIFTGQHLCCILFFNKVVGFSPATLLKKRL